MSKLEDVMKKRADDKAAADRAARQAAAKAEEEKNRRHEAYYKAEFNKRFAELKQLVSAQAGLYKIVPCSCRCGGNFAWVRFNRNGAQEMIGCVCHTKIFDEAK